MTVGQTQDSEDELLRSVAIQNAHSILQARRRAEEELFAAKEALEARTAELERANTLIRTIAENAASSLLMLDWRGVVTYMNPAAVAETGYTLEEFGTAPFHDVLHAAADREQGHSLEACPIRNARERMEPLRNHRDFFVRKDGSTFPVACSLAPLQRDGEPAGGVLEFRDISDELRAQKTLEDANKRKDEFLATLSHELRTPMTAVLGWTRMLKLGLPAADAHEALDAIEKSAMIQAQLIDDVLDVSRTVAGKMTFQPVVVDVGPALRAAMTTIHPAAAAKGIDMLSSIPPILPRVLGDEGRLQQIMWNLLSNAVKFTPRGGSVTVRVAVDGPILRLTVRDTGRGIAPGYLAHVFEPFSQEDGSSARSHEGIGLGLSIVRSLVELHGGTIRVASDGPGQGSMFTVELPVLTDAGEPQQRIAVVAGMRGAELPALQGTRVLVVDDHELPRELMVALFRRAEAEVSAATSVRDALALFEQTRPHVVVCDLAMPDEDGYAFLRTVRELPGPARTTPVIALTAFSRPEERQHALSAGFDAYVKKPVDPMELAATAKRLAAGRG